MDITQNSSARAAQLPQGSDLEGITRNGARARARGVGYFENPHLMSEPNTLGLEECFLLTSAWWSGWLKEDAGRTETIQRMLAKPIW